MASKPGRNDACPCGSGKKFKQCCEAKKESSSRLLLVVVAGIMLAAVFFAISAAMHDSSATGAPGKVWSAEHGHYH